MKTIYYSEVPLIAGCRLGPFDLIYCVTARLYIGRPRADGILCQCVESVGQFRRPNLSVKNHHYVSASAPH